MRRAVCPLHRMGQWRRKGQIYFLRTCLWWYRYELLDTHNTHAQSYVTITTTSAAARLFAVAWNRVAH